MSNPILSRDRAHRQQVVAEWCASAFGAEHQASVPQRAVRLLEEAVEAYQSAGCTEEMAHALVAYVFGRPSGEMAAELGGVGITLLALAAAAGMNADELELRELQRVLSKPIEHFRRRNEAKNAAGFDVTPKGQSHG